MINLGIGVHISNNPNITIDFIKNNPNKRWDWDWISKSPNMTMDIIRKNPDLARGIGNGYLRMNSKKINKYFMKKDLEIPCCF